MNPLAQAASTGSIGEFTVGAPDVDARTQGVTSVGRGAPIRGFRVTAGTGILAYVDDRTGAVCQVGNVTALVVGDEITPEWGISIRSINGTGNSTPSAALSLRCIW